MATRLVDPIVDGRLSTRANRSWRSAVNSLVVVRRPSEALIRCRTVSECYLQGGAESCGRTALLTPASVWWWQPNLFISAQFISRREQTIIQRLATCMSSMTMIGRVGVSSAKTTGQVMWLGSIMSSRQACQHQCWKSDINVSDYPQTMWIVCGRHQHLRNDLGVVTESQLPLSAHVALYQSVCRLAIFTSVDHFPGQWRQRPQIFGPVHYLSLRLLQLSEVCACRYPTASSGKFSLYRTLLLHGSALSRYS